LTARSRTRIFGRSHDSLDPGSTDVTAVTPGRGSFARIPLETRDPMAGDLWRRMLLDDDRDGPDERLSISRRSVVRAARGILAAGVVIVAAFAWLLLDGSARLEAERLQREKARLAGQLDELRTRVTDLEGSLQGLAEHNARMRVIAGMAAIDDDVLEVGVGGPGLARPQQNPLWAADSALASTAFTVSYDLQALERRARLLSESMAEATDSLVVHRDLLERTPSILPTDGLVSSSFSRARWHPILDRAIPHEGMDISASRGTPIFAAARGTVVRAGRLPGYGDMVEIDHGHGYVTRYGHVSKLLVRRGQRVERGDAIAQVGSSGTATSPHLHYEVLVDGVPRNPEHFILASISP